MLENTLIMSVYFFFMLKETFDSTRNEANA